MTKAENWSGHCSWWPRDACSCLMIFIDSRSKPNLQYGGQPFLCTLFTLFKAFVISKDICINMTWSSQDHLLLSALQYACCWLDTGLSHMLYISLLPSKYLNHTWIKEKKFVHHCPTESMLFYQVQNILQSISSRISGGKCCCCILLHLLLQTVYFHLLYI